MSLGSLGRLGNQMFQLASSVGIGMRLKMDAKFSKEIVLGGSKESPNSYSGCKLNECFEIPESLLSPHEEIVRNLKHRYQEVDFRYNKETEKLPAGTDLYGYFQTDKYFKEYRDEILKIFTFKKDLKERSDSFLDVKENYVSVHVRRGDYLQYPQHHPFQSVEYYTKAMEKFPQDSIFCLFSDDINWCKENFIGENFLFIDTGSPYYDLYLMTKFKNHIIANSSFSWWGSWLSESKKTIAPSIWFGPAMNKDTSDVFCQNWIKI